jgi:hypothetical protein
MSGLKPIWSGDKLVGTLPFVGEVVDIILNADEFISSPISIRTVFVQIHGATVGMRTGAFMDTSNRVYTLETVSAWRTAQSLTNEDIVE